MKFGFKKETRRVIEILIMIAIAVTLFILTRLETEVYDLSEKLAKNVEFYYSLIYFGIINFNVIILALLSFLIVRNLAKLLVERKRGVFGSRLRAKLVLTLVLFATAPTILLFYISTNFITNSFDSWFSSKVAETMNQTREIGQELYREDQKRLKSLAQLAQRKTVEILLEPSSTLVDNGPPEYNYRIQLKGLRRFQKEFNIDFIHVFDRDFNVLYSSDGMKTWKIPYVLSPKNYARLNSINVSPSQLKVNQSLGAYSSVATYDGFDVVQGVSIVFSPKGEVIGFILLETKFNSQILNGMEAVLREFAGLKPSAQYIKLSYLILLASMCFLILFSAIWAGFYVSRGIIGPIQKLALATKEIALGNYRIELKQTSEDETGILVNSFNKMTSDLLEQEEAVRKSSQRLKSSNEELDKFGKYVQTILENISAGVFSVDMSGNLSTFNRAAEKLLQLDARDLIGRAVEDSLPLNILSHFWKPVVDKLKDADFFSGQIDVVVSSVRKLTLLVHARRIFDESGVYLGFLVVFDDTTEQVKVQKMAAWKEVARRIAHEIKNPITPIKLNSQRLQRRFASRFSGEDAEVFDSCIRSITDQVDTISHLIGEFSKFSKMPSINLRPEDLEKMLFEIISMYKNSYPNLPIDFSSNLNNPIIQIDKPQMKRVVINLINNSIESMESALEDAEISVKLRKSADQKYVELQIEDNGPGVPKDLTDQVLLPYFSTKAEGTGLGLSIVQQIISDHGGYFKLSNRSEGGASIQIRLPLS